MLAKTFITVFLTRQRHGAIDAGNDLPRIAPGVVALKQIATQAIAHKRLRRLENLRFGPAKTVNTLLGVAHNEHTGRCAATTGPRVASQP